MKVVVHYYSVTQLCLTLCNTVNYSMQASPPLTISQSLPKFMSTASVMPSSHLILWCPLLLLPSIFPSIKDFSESAVCIRWPKYWSFSFSINPSNQYSGLISLKIDWFDLLAVQGTLRSLFQYHSLKASILWHSAFFMVSQPYMTTGKTIALTILDLLSAEWCRCFSTHCQGLSQLSCQEAIIFWFHGCSHHLQRFLEPKKRKFVTISPLTPFICHEVMGLDAMILDFFFLIFSFKLALSLFSFTLIMRLFSSCSLSATAYLMLLFFAHILILACNSSSLAFLMICSEYRLNQQEVCKKMKVVVGSKNLLPILCLCLRVGTAMSCMTHVSTHSFLMKTSWRWTHSLMTLGKTGKRTLDGQTVLQATVSGQN